MGDAVLRADGVGKKFCKTLKHNMLYGAVDLARDFLGLPARTDHLRQGEFWSLDGVSFELKRGECLGLIGPNGAGKSTLLKILNGIITPDRGRVEITGRVGGLIEVGAGFHPLLTGRENVYVNGAILGLSKREISRRFDDIVEFSGLEEFIDTPVKHYSSGMYVRLGFAIAVQMEPDVLLIDEILAVGDAGFRSRCYNRIGQLAERSAIVFVSHAMPAVSRLATSAMVISRGTVEYHGPTAEGISRYHALFSHGITPSRQGSGAACILSIDFYDAHRRPAHRIRYGEQLHIDFRIRAEILVKDACIDLVFLNVAEEAVAECNNLYAGHQLDLDPGHEIAVRATIGELTLNAGIYRVSALLLSKDMVTHYDWLKDAVTIEVVADRIGVAGQQFRADWGPLSKEQLAATP